MTRLSGVYAAMVTPYGVDGAVNLDTVARLADYIIAEGVDGIFPCGTTGEFPLLSKQERMEITRVVQETIGGRARVLANVSSLDTRETLDFLRQARHLGIRDVSVVAPSYYIFDHAALVEYFRWVCDQAADLDVYLYNIPANTRNPITPKLLAELLSTCGNIKGIKDSSMDLMVLTDYLRCAGESFTVLTGNDAQVLAALQAGGAGGLIASASVFPRISKEIEACFRHGDIAGARKRQNYLYDFRQLCRSIMPVTTHKFALERLGFPMGDPRLPYRKLSEAEKRTVTLRLDELKATESAWSAVATCPSEGANT